AVRPLGASLLIVYRDVNNPSLSAIAIYGGGVQVNQANDRMDQTLGGIVQASASPKGKLSLIFANGQANFSENLHLNGGAAIVNPFVHGWDNPTYTTEHDFSMLPGATSATFSIDSQGISNSDCLNGGLAILMVSLDDVDQDGLADSVEDSSVDPSGNPWALPTGEPLPDIHEMGASSAKPDLFVEFAAMRALAPQVQGTGANAVIVPAHDHKPPPSVW